MSDRIRVLLIASSLLAAAAALAGLLVRNPLAAGVLAIGAAAASALALFSLPKSAEAEPLPEIQAAPEVTPAPPDVTVLVAEVRDSSGEGRFGGDLRRILEGIVRDEKGKLHASNGAITAVFRGRRDHARAAVHAAQRMLSNVDALSRRLERDVRISIGVDTAEEASATTRAAELQKMADENRTAVLVSASTVGHLPSERAILAAIDSDARLYSFTPVQQRLF